MSHPWTSLRDVLLDRAETHGDVLAYRWGPEQMTFATLAERATARARALSESGLAQGDRVALVLSPGPSALEHFWAAQLIGALPCLFNPFVPADTLRARIEGIQPRLVCTDAEATSTLPRLRGTVPHPPIDAEDVAYLQMTSGTTGAPRAALIRHRNVLACLGGRNRVGDFNHDDVLVNRLPIWHDFGLVSFAIAAVYFGLPCHMVNPSIGALPQWLATIGEVGGTHTGGPDFGYRLASRMVKPEQVDLSSLRLAWSGAEPVRWATVTEFEDRFARPGVIVPAYGLAEATLGVTTHLPGDERVVDARGNVSNGWPMSKMEVRAGASAEHPEEILVKGDLVFAGYFGADDETAEKLAGGWLHTGDTGYLDEQGRLFVLGRRASLIKRGGSMVAPRELEEAAHRVANVRMAAAVSLTEPGRDDVIVVVVEPQTPDEANALGAEVSAAVHAALGFAPHRVAVVPPRSIPRSDSGKIRYGLLADALREGTIG
jgi:fatty-acyl-CoA synthase